MNKRIIKIPFVLALVIIIWGVVTVNIRWTAENIEMEPPLKNQIEKLQGEDMNLKKYAVDRSPIKIFYNKEDNWDLRIMFQEYSFILNEESLGSFKKFIKEGIEGANENIGEGIKKSISRVLEVFAK